MAGLSLIGMSFLRRLKPIAWPVTALAVALVSPLLWKAAPQHPVLDILWGTHHNAAFPLFPWVIYPLLGMYWGTRFHQAADTDRFMNVSAGIGAGLVLLGGLLWAAVDTPFMPVGDYSRSGCHIHLIITGFVFVWLWLIRHAGKRLANSGIRTLLIFWSRHVTPVYVIQWVMIGWGVLIFGYRQLPADTAALIGILMAGLTHVLMKIYLSFKHS